MSQSAAEIPRSEQRKRSTLENLKALFAEVGSLSNQLRKAVDDSDSVRLGDRAILKVLNSAGPLTVPEVARVRATSRQNIQMLVNRLEAEGCVELAGNPAHRRSALVRITERGRVMLGAAKVEEAKSLEKLLPYVSETELDSATTTLQRVRELLATTETPPAGASKTRSAPRPGTPHLKNGGTPRSAASRSIEDAKEVATTAPDTSGEEDFPVNLL